MAQIVVNGNVYGEPSPIIVVNPMYNEGIKVAEIIINGDKTDIYIPDNSQNNGGNQ